MAGTNNRELEAQLYQQKDENGLQTLLEYATIAYERERDALCGCVPEDTKFHQGRANAYHQLIRVLTEEPIQI